MGDLAQLEFAGLPVVVARTGGVRRESLLEYRPDLITAVAAAGGTRLPEAQVGESVEVFTRGAQLWAVEDGLSTFELLQQFVEFGRGGVGGLARGMFHGVEYSGPGNP